MRGVEAKHPDQLLLDIIKLAPGSFCAAVKEQANALRNSPRVSRIFSISYETRGLSRRSPGFESSSGHRESSTRKETSTRTARSASAMARHVRFTPTCQTGWRVVKRARAALTSVAPVDRMGRACGALLTVSGGDRSSRRSTRRTTTWVR